MNEFIENFQEFKSWLYECYVNGNYQDFDKVVEKFELLNLDKAF